VPDAVHATSAVTATAFAKRFHPNPPPDIIAEEPEWAWSAPEQPASDSEPRCHETQTELASVNQVAFLGQLSASIAEINQPISAVVMNAEAALRLLLAQPTDTEAVRRLLANPGFPLLEIAVQTGVLRRDRRLRHATFPVNGARRGCHVRVMGGDRAIGGHTPTNRHSFIAGARSADNFRAQAPLGRALGCSVEGEEPQGESHDPDEASKINASPRVFEGVFHHSGCDCSQ
jgi:hypothetical protein